MAEIPRAFISKNFEKFYFIPGFFTLSLSLPFFIVYLLGYMILMDYFSRKTCKYGLTGILGDWRYRPKGFNYHNSCV